MYVGRRLFAAGPTLLLVCFVVFAAIRVVPGDPATTMAGMDAPPEVVEQIRRDLGLDRPFPVQFGAFLLGLIQLDLGRSLFSHLPVADELGGRLPSSLLLATSALLLATVFGIGFGVLAASRRGRASDRAVRFGVTVLLAVPSYVLGLLLILVFASQLRLLPASGAVSPAHYVLPTLTLAAPIAAIIARQTRSAVLDVLGEDYVRTARAKGIGERSVLLHHGLRNALIPVITILGLWFGSLLGGLVIVETIFAVPGVGSLIVERILARDYPVVQGGVLLIAFCIVVVNIVVDLAYGAVDPRIRLS